jgi:hypothetical protein
VSGNHAKKVVQGDVSEHNEEGVSILQFGKLSAYAAVGCETHNCIYSFRANAYPFAIMTH